jgi:hypothetical protein
MRPWLAGVYCVFLCLTSLNAELRFSPDIASNPQRMERILAAVELLREYAPESPAIRWSYPQEHERYAGDLWICSQPLEDSTLGQWDGAQVVLNSASLDSESIFELALIIYHEAIHGDHHYGDLESLLLNEYALFFSPRQYLLFEMLNEGLAVYKETVLRYDMGINTESEHKYSAKPSLAYYAENFYGFFKDLRRWMKASSSYGTLPVTEFEEALFREFLLGFFSDPWYLDYYMPPMEQHFTILRGADFAVCPPVCSPAFARFAEHSGVRAVLDRYLEKNSPRGFTLGLNSEELELFLDQTIASLEGEVLEKQGPERRGVIHHARSYHASQRNFETLPARYGKLPPGLEIRYTYSIGGDTISAFNKLLDRLGVK